MNTSPVSPGVVRPLAPGEPERARAYQVLYNGKYIKHPDGRVELLPLSSSERKYQEEDLQAVTEGSPFFSELPERVQRMLRHRERLTKLQNLRGQTFPSEDALDVALTLMLGPEAIALFRKTFDEHYGAQAATDWANYCAQWEGSRYAETLEDGADWNGRPTKVPSRKSLGAGMRRVIRALIDEGMIPGTPKDYRVSVRLREVYTHAAVVVVRTDQGDRFEILEALKFAFLPWNKGKAEQMYDDCAVTDSTIYGVEVRRTGETW